MITTLLISHLAKYLAGVLHTTLKMMPTIEPGFDKGAIASYQNEFGFFPCKIIERKPWRADSFQLYCVKVAPGLFVDIPSFELLTGWEDNFPDWSEINWGRWTKWTSNEVAEPLADDYSDSQWNPHEEWQPDDDYYSNLAEEWEREEAGTLS